MLTFSASGLPVGLTISPTTGQITGTLGAIETVAVTIVVDDPSGAQVQATFVWTVEEPLTALSFPSPPAVVGDAVLYTAQTNLAGTYEYSWDFGDGNAAGPNPVADVTHGFSAPGRFVVTLTVVDPATGFSDQLQFVQIITAAPTALRPAASSTIAHEPANARVWTVNPDNDSVHVLDAVSHTTVGEVAVCDSPQSVAVAADGRIWVPCQYADTIDVIDPLTLTVVQQIPLDYGARPRGVAFAAGTGTAYVVLEAKGQVLKLDGVSGAVLGSIDVGRHVRSIAVTADGAHAWVARFVTPLQPGESSGAPSVASAAGAEVLRLDTATMTIDSVTILQSSTRPDGPQSARGVPNYLGGLAISPQGTEMLVASKQDNIFRGQHNDGLDLSHDVTVRAITSRVDLATGLEDPTTRIDHDNAGVAKAVAYSKSGAYAFTVLQGNRQLSIIDPFSHAELGRVATGFGPSGVALSQDGRTLFVDDFTGRTVSVFDLSNLIDHDDTALVPLATVPKVAVEALAPDVLAGKRLFYDAADPRLSLESYMSCASCHDDGGNDGRVWDFHQFGEGLRNGISIDGHGGHGPLHWSANFDEVQDFEGQIRDFAGGTGLMSDPDFAATAAPLGPAKAGLSADLDALAAYVGSLRTVGRSPHRESDGAFTSEALLGRDVFASSGCGACHAGPTFTNSSLGVTHDVGTLLPTSGPQTALDTPTLRGLWMTAPYLHDGRAATLQSATVAHAGVAVVEPELSQLAAYLLQIDDAEMLPPNGIPVVADPGAQSFAEGTAVSLTVDAHDPEGAPLTFSAAGLPLELAIDPATGEVSGALGHSAAGSYAVTVTADDGMDSGMASFTLDVTDTNRPPQYQGVSSFLIHRLVPLDVPFSATDPDGDPVTITATGLPPGLVWDPVSESAVGAPTLAGNFAGTLELTDGQAPVSIPLSWNVVVTQCTNGIDDDNDGSTDFDGGGVGAPDPDCDGPGDTTERSRGSSSCGLGPEIAALLLPIALARRWRERRRPGA